EPHLVGDTGQGLEPREIDRERPLDAPVDRYVPLARCKRGRRVVGTQEEQRVVDYGSIDHRQWRGKVETVAPRDQGRTLVRVGCYLRISHKYCTVAQAAASARPPRLAPLASVTCRSDHRPAVVGLTLGQRNTL